MNEVEKNVRDYEERLRRLEEMSKRKQFGYLAASVEEIAAAQLEWEENQKSAGGVKIMAEKYYLTAEEMELFKSLQKYYLKLQDMQKMSGEMFNLELVIEKQFDAAMAARGRESLKANASNLSI